MKSPGNGNETCRMMQVYWSYTCLNCSDNTLHNTSVAPGTLLASKFPQQWQEILKLNVDSLLPSVWPASVSIWQCKNNQLSTTVITTRKSSNWTTQNTITVQLLSLSFFLEPSNICPLVKLYARTKHLLWLGVHSVHHAIKEWPSLFSGHETIWAASAAIKTLVQFFDHSHFTPCTSNRLE